MLAIGLKPPVTRSLLYGKAKYAKQDSGDAKHGMKALYARESLLFWEALFASIWTRHRETITVKIPQSGSSYD